jgi:hypothetical protein
MLLQFFVGIGALVGGLCLIMDSSGAGLGLSTASLQGTPFGDYFVPGVVLLIINGCGSIAGALMTLFAVRRFPLVAVVLGLFLMTWMVVQVWFLGLVHWQQPLYFVFGVLEFYLGRRLLSRIT